MHLMLLNAILPGSRRRMTGLTARELNARVAMFGCGKRVGCLRFFVAGIAVLWLAVQFMAGVAVGAIHSLLAEMHIAGDVFMLAQVFVTDTATVTSRAGARHGRSFFKHMTVEKPAAYACRLAHMTIAAGGVAARTMVVEHHLQLWVILWNASRCECRPVALLSCVQAIRVDGSSIGMTFAATRDGVLAWASDQAGVSGLLIGSLNSAVTHGALHLPVYRAAELIEVDEHFFPWLQRSHISPSTHSFRFALDHRLLRRCGVNQHLLIRVAGHTIIRITRRRGRGRFGGQVNRFNAFANSGQWQNLRRNLRFRTACQYEQDKPDE